MVVAIRILEPATKLDMQFGLVGWVKGLIPPILVMYVPSKQNKARPSTLSYECRILQKVLFYSMLH